MDADGLTEDSFRLSIVLCRGAGEWDGAVGGGVLPEALATHSPLPGSSAV